jgi:hypothetical protein
MAIYRSLPPTSRDQVESSTTIDGMAYAMVLPSSGTTTYHIHLLVLDGRSLPQRSYNLEPRWPSGRIPAVRLSDTFLQS